MEFQLLFELGVISHPSKLHCSNGWSQFGTPPVWLSLTGWSIYPSGLYCSEVRVTRCQLLASMLACSQVLHLCSHDPKSINQASTLVFLASPELCQVILFSMGFKLRSRTFPPFEKDEGTGSTDMEVQKLVGFLIMPQQWL